jgi:hypothetical protein
MFQRPVARHWGIAFSQVALQRGGFGRFWQMFSHRVFIWLQEKFDGWQPSWAEVPV